MHQANCGAGALCSGSVIIGPREPPRRHPPGRGVPPRGAGAGKFSGNSGNPAPRPGRPGGAKIGPKSGRNLAPNRAQNRAILDPILEAYIYTIVLQEPPQGGQI